MKRLPGTVYRPWRPTQTALYEPPPPLTRPRTAPERSPHRAPRSDTGLRPRRARPRIRPVPARRLRPLRLPNHAARRSPPAQPTSPPAAKGPFNSLSVALRSVSLRRASGRPTSGDVTPRPHKECAGFCYRWPRIPFWTQADPLSSSPALRSARFQRHPHRLLGPSPRSPGVETDIEPDVVVGLDSVLTPRDGRDRGDSR